MNDKKPTEVCIASVKDPAYMHHADCSRHQEKQEKPDWKERLHELAQVYGDRAYVEIIGLVADELTRVYNEGKAYWEPSEHHKDVWRNEGAEKAMKQRDAEVDAAYEKGKADQREEIFVWLASQPRTGLLVTEFSIKFPLINYGK